MVDVDIGVLQLMFRPRHTVALSQDPQMQKYG